MTLKEMLLFFLMLLSSIMGWAAYAALARRGK